MTTRTQDEIKAHVSEMFKEANQSNTRGEIHISSLLLNATQTHFNVGARPQSDCDIKVERIIKTKRFKTTLQESRLTFFKIFSECFWRTVCAAERSYSFI